MPAAAVAVAPRPVPAPTSAHLEDDLAAHVPGLAQLLRRRRLGERHALDLRRAHGALGNELVKRAGRSIKKIFETEWRMGKVIGLDRAIEYALAAGGD